MASQSIWRPSRYASVDDVWLNEGRWLAAISALLQRGGTGQCQTDTVFTSCLAHAGHDLGSGVQRVWRCKDHGQTQPGI